MIHEPIFQLIIALSLCYLTYKLSEMSFKKKPAGVPELPGKKLNSPLIFFEKRRINRDDKERYMTRFTVFECKYISFKFHKFHASDDQCLHDHPWSFISFILWGGYNEITPTDPKYFELDLFNESVTGSKFCRFTTKRVYPGMILYRPAKSIHRVELITRKGEYWERPAYTFVISLKRTRKWGFFTKSGWMHWKEYGNKQKEGAGNLC